ncbi:VOC family protein [Sphingopyxis sp. PET50]|uniref:VOC family protein n=1 Tax=Sphingopyxis sp. PET50 TaxID=2976533 RepID=UPI0021AF333A|nr:VOC family protein [Sphingopyxis sp. PET50]
MYSHNMVGSNDLDASKKFYDATFQAIGGKAGIQDDKGRLIYMHNGGIFMVTAPIDGQPATIGNGCTIGFAMEGPEQADAWHKAGVENGGTSIEDPPGVRDGGFGQLYLAYLRDPSGNKLCALHRIV